MQSVSEPVRRELPTRLVLGSAMLALVGALFWLDTRYTDGLLTAAALALLALGGVLEYVALLRRADRAVDGAVAVGATVLLCGIALLPAFRGALEDAPSVLALATFAVLLAASTRALGRARLADGLHAQAAALLGFVWIAWPLFVAQDLVLRHTPSVLYVVLVCKVGDIGAYFAGTAFGRRKLIPHVSKGKTVEGTAGSVLASCAVAALLREPLGPPGPVLGLTAAIGLGIILNAGAQLGDLTESALKRSCGAKDSSHLLPAHGGILDLIDSLLLSFPIYYVTFQLHHASLS